MKRRSKKVANAKEEEEIKDKLDQQWRKLQQDWDTFNSNNNNLSKPKAPRLLLRRCSSTTDSTAIVNALPLLDNSPRNLMSSLQHRRSSPPPSEHWRREDIRRERRAAIESGKLKGWRRLFGDPDEREEEMGSSSSCCCYGSHDEVSDGNCGSSKGQVVHCCCCCSSCSGSCLSDEKVERGKVLVVGGEKAVGVNNNVEVEVEVEVKRDDECDGGRLMVVMGWFSFALMVFTLAIIYMRFNGRCEYEAEIMLVPT
ncbi:hypothetical protein ACSBR2_042365 [Camellia fascicularis]